MPRRAPCWRTSRTSRAAWCWATRWSRPAPRSRARSCCPWARCAPAATCASRSTTSPACSPRSPASSPSTASGSRASSSASLRRGPPTWCCSPMRPPNRRWRRPRRSCRASLARARCAPGSAWKRRARDPLRSAPALARPAAGHPPHSGAQPGRGRHAAGRRAHARARRGLRGAVAEGRGTESHRVVQGPRHGGGRGEGRRGGRADGGVRLDREHLRLRRRLLRRGRHRLPRGRPRRKGRAGQAGAGGRARSPHRRSARELRRRVVGRARLAARGGIALLNSVNPYRLEGQKTAAFEVVEALGGPPDGLALPVGNAGNISAYWRGFVELGMRLPIYGIQAAGAAPLVSGAPVEHPETLATAIRIGNPASWTLAVQAQRESGGQFAAVPDEEIVAAYARLAAEAGVFCEPASAAPVAGLLRLSRERPGRFAGQRLVAVLTGHGLKDPQAAIGLAPPLPEPVAVESIEEALR